MSSRIEQLIDEIDEYIDSCKYQTFSNTKILVNKDEIEELIHELREKTPDEIKRYQKIIQNKEEILSDARSKAEQLISDATAQTTELINEHEIMLQAYAQANDVVTTATKQAQEILDTAAEQANSMKLSAVKYTDDLLAHVETIIENSIQTAASDYETMIGNLKQYQDIIVANRQELRATDETGTESDVDMQDSIKPEDSGDLELI